MNASLAKKNVILAAAAVACMMAPQAHADTFDFTRITNTALTAAQSQSLFNNVATELGHISYFTPSNSAEHNGWHETFPAAIGVRYHVSQIGMLDTVQSGGSTFAMDRITAQAGFLNGFSLGMMVLMPAAPKAISGVGFEARYDLSQHTGIEHAHWNIRYTNANITGINDATTANPTATNALTIDSTGIGTMVGYSFKSFKPYASIDFIRYTPTITTGFTGLKANTSNGVTATIGAKIYLSPMIVLGIEYQKMDWTASTDISFGAEF